MTFEKKQQNNEIISKFAGRVNIARERSFSSQRDTAKLTLVMSAKKILMSFRRKGHG